MSSLEFEFPDTGEGVTEGEFLEWLVEEGDEVEEDQTVAEVETDKAVVDVPAPAPGTVKELRAEPGGAVKVGEVIMVLETEEGSPDKSSDETNIEANVEETQEEVTEDKGAEKPAAPGDALALPKVRKLAREKDLEIGSIQGSGPGGRVTEEDVMEAEASGSSTSEPETSPNETSVNASPSVRKLAREKGVDITGIEGSGRGGKITREDVLDAEGRSGSKSRETEEREVERVPMSNIEKTMAEKMSESRFTAPHVTHVEKADVTELVELREDKKDGLEVHLTYLPFIMKAAVLAMKDYPELNSELDEESDEVILKKYYDFNIAVETEDGLLTPIIRGVDDKNILELAAEISEKAGKAKEREISPSDLEVGTFAITNLGVIGGEEFTPIIEYPQVAILGIGRIGETAEVFEGEVVPRHTVKLSLSYDHRVVDGATAARFMNRLVENLEDPDHMLMEM